MKIIQPAVLLFAAGLFAGPIETLKPGEWYEVPNSHLEAIKASSTQFPWVANGEGFPGIMNDWCGGAFDTQRDRLLIGPGGGHNGYAGNEVYAFDLNDLQWRRLNNPDPLESGECTNDSVPFAMHTYDRLEYVPAPVDRFLEVGGWCTNHTYLMNLATNKWEKINGVDAEGNVTNGMSALDPVTNTVWAGHGALQQFNPVTKVWGKKTQYDNSIYWGRITLTCDPARRLLVGVGVVDLGTGGGANSPATVTWDISNLSATITATKITTTGATDIMQGGQNGTEFDAVAGKIVGWKGGADVYSLDLDTKVWTRHAPTNSVTPGSPNGNGTFGRFRYSPKKNVYVVVNAVNQNVFLYRLAGGATAAEKGVSPALQLSGVPNPARIGTLVKIAGAGRFEISDIAGRRVFQGVAGQNLWSTAGMAAGIYIARPLAAGMGGPRKILLQ